MAPRRSIRATSSGSDRVSARPRRTSTSGGFRRSARSRTNRRTNVTQRGCLTHQAEWRIPASASAPMISAAKIPSATTIAPGGASIRAVPAAADRAMS